MRAYDTIREVYAKDNRLDEFDKALVDHLSTGIVFSLPEAFVMCKAVRLEDGRFAWLVEAAAGKMRSLINCWPGYLPWIAFCRSKDKSRRVRIYSTERFFRLTTKAGGY